VVAANVRAALATLDQSEVFIRMALAVLVTME
jgi:hypothetical protein